MTLYLLNRAGDPWQDAGGIHQLLIPDIPAPFRKTPLYDAVFLANMWRLQRHRPHLIAFKDDTSSITESDRKYIQSLDTRFISGRESTTPLRYVVNGDISAMVPQTEDDFFLLVPNAPPKVLPPWPLLITDLDAVYLSRSDEFIKVITSDAALLELIASLAKIGPSMPRTERPNVI